MSHIKRIAHYSLWGAALLTLLTVGLHFLMPYLINTQMVRERLLARVAPLISGDVDFDTIGLALFPLPHVTVSGVRIERPDQLKVGVDAVSLYPHLRSLLQGRLAIGSAQAVSPDVTVHLPAATEENATPDDTGTAIGLMVLLTRLGTDGRLSFENGRLEIRRAATVLLRLAELNLSVHAPEDILHAELQGQMDVIDQFRIAMTFPRPASNPEASSPITLTIEARRADAGQLRERLLEFIPTAATWTVLDIIRNGTIETVTLATTATSWDSLGRLETLTVSGQMVDGHIRVPGAALDLAAVTGEVTIADGVLTAHRVTARLGATTADQGTLTLELLHRPLSMNLDIALDADLSQLPPILTRVVRQRNVLDELDRLQRVAGRATGKLALQGAVTDLAVTATAETISLAVDYDRLPHRLEIAAGQIRYTGDALQISGLQGRLRSSTFDNVAAEVRWRDTPWIDMKQMAARIACDEILPWLIPHIEQRFGEGIIQEPGGHVRLVNARFSGPLTDPARWQFSGNGALENVRVTSAGFPGPITVTRGRWELRDDRLSISETRLVLLDATIEGTATIAPVGAERPAVTVSLNGTLERQAVQWLHQWLQAPEPLEMPAPIVIPQMNIAWPVEGILAIQGTVELPAGLTLEGTLNTGPDLFDLRQLSFADAHSEGTLAIRFNGPEATRRVRFQGRLAQRTLSSFWPVPGPNDGWIDGHLAMQWTAEAPGAAEIEGDIEVTDWMMPPTLWASLLIHRLHLSGNNAQLEIHALDLSWHDQRAALQGKATIAQEVLELDLALSADALDLNRLLQAIPASQQGKQSTEAPPGPGLPRVQGTIAMSVGRLNYGHYQWEPMQATLNWDHERAEMVITEAYLCGISTVGQLTWAADGLAMTLTPSAENQALRYAGGCLTGAPSTERLEGTYAVSGRLASTGTSAEELIRNLEGVVYVDIVDGRLYNIGEAGLFTNLLSFLTLNNLVRGELPNMRERDFHYHRIYLQLRFQDNRMVLDEADLFADAFNMVGEGTMDLLSRQLDLTVLVSPLTTLDTLIRHLPIVGRILQGTLVAIPMGIKGPLHNPQVMPLSPKSVGTRLLGILERTLQAPFRLIEPILPGTPERNHRGQGGPTQ